jgi:hypothetical protein
MGRYRSKGRGRGSRRLTHLAEFGMWVAPLLDLGPGLLGLEDRVADIGMIVGDRVGFELIISF